jgi:hypothetical protein
MTSFYMRWERVHIQDDPAFFEQMDSMAEVEARGLGLKLDRSSREEMELLEGDREHYVVYKWQTGPLVDVPSGEGEVDQRG